MNMQTSHALLLLSACALLLEISCSSGPGSAGSPDAGSTSVAVTPQLLGTGRTLYQANCVPCHGAQGRGDGPSSATLDPKPRDHTDRTYMDGLSDQDLAQVINMGGVIRRMPQMPSHPHIRDKELVALIAYVRSLSRDTVEKVDLGSAAR